MLNFKLGAKAMLIACLIGFFITSCSNQDGLEEAGSLQNAVVDNSTTQSSQTNYNLLGQALAGAMNESPAFRKLLKKEALKKFDKDYDILYHMIKDVSVSNDQTVRDLLVSHFENPADLERIEREEPLITLFIPKLPEFSAESWDIDSDIPKVAVYQKEEDDLIFYSNEGAESIEMPEGAVPAFPLIVLKLNERVVLSNSSIAGGRSLAISSDSFSFSFIDDSFDGTRQDDGDEDDGNTEIERWTPTPNSKLRTAYSAYYWNTIQWQRDHIYYNLMPPNTTRGRLDSRYVETISTLAFRNGIAPTTAYNRISDHSGDPDRISGSTRWSGSRFPWIEGNFEFVITVIRNGRSGGSPLVKRFPVQAEELFNIQYTRDSPWSQYYITNISLKAFRPNLEISTWDLQEYGMTWKYQVSEYDPIQSTTRSYTHTSEFANNFSLKAGLFEKVELNFGTTNKTVDTQTMTVSTDFGNDDLGELEVRFDAPVIFDNYNPGSGPIYGIRSYDTGWINMTIEPALFGNP